MKKYVKRTAFVCIAAAILLTAAETVISNRFIESETIEIFPKGLPKEFDGFRILLVSDVHGRYACDLDELVRLAAEAAPDIIAYTGDAINDSADSVDEAAELMRRLCEVAPVYYVSGNHEYASLKDITLFREFERAGAIVLRNGASRITRDGASIPIVGIDDLNGYDGMLPMSESLAQFKDLADECALLLCHRYDRADEAAEFGFSMMLSGHAHGGLVRLPFTDGLIGPGRDLFPKRTNGYYGVGGMELVVSRGLGNAGIPRVGSRLHLPVVVLRSGT